MGCAEAYRSTREGIGPRSRSAYALAWMRESSAWQGLRGFGALGCTAALTLLARDARGAPPWTHRALTLPSGDWSFDLGLGVGHVAPPPDSSAVGINAEMAVGLTDRVELGVRTGVRFGEARERAIDGDAYGRLFDRQTFDDGSDLIANPEIRVRGAVVRASVVEVALEGRIVLPLSAGSSAGALFGVPLAFHVGRRVRIDLGAYVPTVLFPHDAVAGLNLPIDVWIQASPRLWLGPMTGLALRQIGQPNAATDVSLGFGLGYAVTHYLDFKASVRFPDVNEESRDFGFGAGVEVRIE
jgi:hypothetical protein